MKIRLILFFVFGCLIALHGQDIYQSSNTELLGRWAMGEAQAVYSDSQFVYAGNGGVLEIYSFSEDDSLTLESRLPLHGAIQDIDVLNQVAYVACGSFGVEVVDVHTSQNPQIIQSVHLGDEVTAVVASDAYATQPIVFALTDIDGLFSYDFSDMENPRQIGYLATISYGKDLFLDEERHRLYCAEYNKGFEIYDVENPAKIGVFDQYDTKGLTYGIFVRDTIAYVADFNKGLQVISVADPYGMFKITEFSTADYAYDVVVWDSMAAVAIGKTGLELIDLTGNSSKQVVDFEDNGSALSVARSGDRVFAANGSSGVKVVRVQEDMSTIEQHLPAFGSSRGVAVQDHYVYVANGFAGMLVLDIADVQNPQLVAHLPISKGYAKNICVADTFAFLAASDGGLYIYSINDPQAPYQLKRMNYSSGNANGVFVKGDTLFLADGGNGVYVYNISDMDAVTLMTNFKTSYSATNVKVRDHYAYVSDYLQGLEVFDISDLSAVRHVSSNTKQVNGMDLDLADSLAFVAAQQSGMRIIDISDPTNIREIGHFRFSSYSSSQGVAARDTLFFEATGKEGVHIVSVSDPLYPHVVGNFETGSMAKDVALQDSLIIVADYNDGVYILKYNPEPETGIDYSANALPFQFELEQNYPNPFNPKTVIRYRLASGAQVNLSVFNVLGQKVKTLVHRKQTSGEHEVSFNAVDLPSGLYFYQLRVDGKKKVKKMLLLR